MKMVDLLYKTFVTLLVLLYIIFRFVFASLIVFLIVRLFIYAFDINYVFTIIQAHTITVLIIFVRLVFVAEKGENKC